MKLVPSILGVLAVVLVVLVPSQAFAWGPFAHLHFAGAILSGATPIPEGMWALLSTYPWHFLYGNVAADIIMAKNLAPAFTHCHSWRKAFQILERAEDDSARAFSWGYLCHLAADVVAHGYYIPTKLVAGFRKRFQKHSYWELRYDERIKDSVADVLGDLGSRQFPACDALLESTIEGTLFNKFETNKRIFDSFMMLQNIKRYRQTIAYLDRTAVRELSDEEIAWLHERSTEAMADVLEVGVDAPVVGRDPRGMPPIKCARKTRVILRRLARKDLLSDAHDEEIGAVYESSFRRYLDTGYLECPSVYGLPVEVFTPPERSDRSTAAVVKDFIQRITKRAKRSP